MKKFLLLLSLLLSVACDKPETPKQEQQQPTPLPPKPAMDPLADNPFIKKPQPTPAPSSPPPPGTFQKPTSFNYVTELPMNDSFQVHVWRDETNNVTCYFFDVKDQGNRAVSCIKN